MGVDYVSGAMLDPTPNASTYKLEPRVSAASLVPYSPAWAGPVRASFAPAGLDVAPAPVALRTPEGPPRPAGPMRTVRLSTGPGEVAFETYDLVRPGEPG